MVDYETLLSADEEELTKLSENLDKNDIEKLIELLSEKNDKLRYKSFTLLLKRSEKYSDVYPFWDEFLIKLKSDNSYQRSIGAVLIAYNARWDKEDRLNEDIDRFLELSDDEKPITVRQCIGAINKIVDYKPGLHTKIADTLMSINIMNLRNTMQKLILSDILNVLLVIRKYNTFDNIENYINKALQGEILDNKSKKAIINKL